MSENELIFRMVLYFRINKKKVQAFMDPAFKVTPDMLAKYNV